MSDALRGAGFSPGARVEVVETIMPDGAAPAAVVCQNAWNFLPRDQYHTLIADYPTKSRALYAARRGVARFNTRRAGTNVVLSAYMRDLLASLGRPTSLLPVTLPWELCSSDTVDAAGVGPLLPDGLSAPPQSVLDEPFILVPGTLTWYKNPGYVLDLVAAAPAAERPAVVFAGTDDGSGCLEATRARAQALGVTTWIGPVSRDAMTWLLARARVTMVPSRLESLSFSMAEALLLSGQVAASPISVHREMARRLDREPMWLPTDPSRTDLQEVLTGGEPIGRVDVGAFRRQWMDLADALNHLSGGAA